MLESSMLRWTPCRRRGRSLGSSPLFWLAKIGVSVETESVDLMKDRLCAKLICYVVGVGDES